MVGNGGVRTVWFIVGRGFAQDGKGWAQFGNDGAEGLQGRWQMMAALSCWRWQFVHEVRHLAR